MEDIGLKSPKSLGSFKDTAVTTLHQILYSQDNPGGWNVVIKMIYSVQNRLIEAFVRL